MGGGYARWLDFGASYGTETLGHLLDRGLLRELLESAAKKSRRTGHRTVFGTCTTKLNKGAQGKHIPGHPHYIEGRSYLTISMEHAQELVDEYGGTGQKIDGQTRERVFFHETIGVYKRRDEKTGVPTSWGMIHYGKRGCHIVPASPDQEQET